MFGFRLQGSGLGFRGCDTKVRVEGCGQNHDLGLRFEVGVTCFPGVQGQGLRLEA